MSHIFKLNANLCTFLLCSCGVNGCAAPVASHKCIATDPMKGWKINSNCWMHLRRADYYYILLLRRLLFVTLFVGLVPLRRIRCYFEFEFLHIVTPLSVELSSLTTTTTMTSIEFRYPGYCVIAYNRMRFTMMQYFRHRTLSTCHRAFVGRQIIDAEMKNRKCLELYRCMFCNVSMWALSSSSK